MQWFYTVFNLVIIGGPLLGCWLWCRSVWHLRYRMLIGLAIVSTVWIALDIWSVMRGWWWYNSQYIHGWYVAGLPIEEVAFFVSVPTACMIILYVLYRKVPGKVRLGHAQSLLIILGCASVLLAVLSGWRERTVFDCIVMVGTISLLYYSSLITHRSFWVWNLAVLGLCLIFNTLLTALPVVLYNEAVVTGIRVGTIPLEDLVYNFSLLNLMALIVRPDAIARQE